jgi:hypothetical protein
MKRTLSICVMCLTVLCTEGFADKACMLDCQKSYQEKTRTCDKEFNDPGSSHYRDTKWHTDCVKQAKAELDSCLKGCQ